MLQKHKTPHIIQRGMMLILSSPSGAGKTTIARELLSQDDRLQLSVSHTTRPKRDNEVEGKDYFFVDLKTFQDLDTKETFIETAEVFGNFYGTSRYLVQQKLSEGYDVVFDIDWQGARSLKAVAAEDVVSFFILPPSNHELLRRINTRAQDSPDVIATRMALADSQISHWNEYDYVILNDDFDKSVRKIRDIIAIERMKQHRQVGLKQFVQTLRVVP